MSKLDLKKLQPKALIPLMAVGVLLVGLIGWFVFVHPKAGEVKKLQGQQQLIQQQISDQQAKTAAARSVPKVHVADVYRLAKAMPDNADMPDLLLELSQLARDSGIEFSTIAPDPALPLAGFSVIPINVTFSGNFFSLTDFLYRLRTLVDVQNARLEATGRLFSVDTMQFSQAADGFPHIRAELLIDAFVFGTDVPTSAAGATPSATPTETTSTDTTSTETTPTTSTEPTASASAAGTP